MYSRDCAGVYAIRHRKSSRSYIGSAKNIEKRWESHVRLLTNGSHTSRKLQHAWDKYGADAFHLVVLERCTNDKLVETEQKWIDRIKSYKQGRGFNILPKAYTHLGAKRSKSACRNLSKGVSRYFSSEESRKKKSEETKKLWQDPKYREAHCKANKERYLRNPQQLKDARANGHFNKPDCKCRKCKAKVA